MSTSVTSHRFGPRRVLVAAVLEFGLVVAACGGGAGGNDDAASDTPAAAGAAVIDTLPDIALVNFDDGATTTLNDYVGKPLVVNFWASWCPSCVAEMSAAFKPVQEQLGDKVTFVGVNIQDSRDKAVKLLDETGVQWISVENEDGSLWAELGGLAMPFTVFISADGEIVDKHNGPLNESLLMKRIEEKLLG